MMRCRAIVATLTVLAVMQPALADGGAVRLSQVSGPYRVTLLTSPTPLRAGVIDVSVVVAAASSDDDLPDAAVELSLVPKDRPEAAISRSATVDGSTTGLFRTATFDVPRGGEWTLAADVSGRDGVARATTDLRIGPPLPRWTAFLGWLILPVILFAAYLWRAWRDARRTMRMEKGTGAAT